MPGLAGEVANLIVALKLDDSGFSGKLNAAARQLKSMDAGLSQVGRGVGQVGTGLGKLATTAGVVAVGGLTAALTTAASMEEAFTGVEKTVDATDQQLEELRQTLRSMSSETGTAFESLAAIGEAGGALGVPTEQLEEFIDVINRLGVSTDLSTDQAATAIGQLRTVLHLGDGEIRSLADTLVALGNAGASTEPQIVDLAARFAAAGNRAGLSADEILALSSAVTSMGVEVEAGGTALSQTFNEIAVAIGKGGEEVEGFTNVLGISAEDFERRWRTDALGTFQDFLRELNKLDPIAQAVALDMAGITGQRQLSAVGLMADNWEFVADQLEITRNKTGALNKESDKFFGTGAAGFRRLRENLRLTADTIGTELLPVTNELISDFIAELQKPETQAGIKDFAEGLADGIRDFADAVGDIDWDPIIGGLEFAGTVAKGVLDLFKSLPGPLQGLIVGGLALNKLSGGGIADILKGVGNITLGGGKLLGGRGATPANPLFVKEVGIPGTGGPAGGGKGGGKIPGLPVGLGTLAGIAALTLPQSGSNLDPRLDPRASQQLDVTVAWEEGLLTDEEYRTLFKLANDGVDVSPKLAELTGGFAGQIAGPPGRGGNIREKEAESFDQNLLQHAVRQGVQELPDTAMLQTQIGRVVTELSPIRTAEQQALATQYAHLSAVREVGSATRGVQATIAGKDFSPTIVVPVQVNFSSTMYQQTVARQVTARQGGGDATTGGI